MGGFKACDWQDETPVQSHHEAHKKKEHRQREGLLSQKGRSGERDSKVSHP